MTLRTMRWWALAAAVAAFVGLGSPAAAQQYTGRIDVTVEDSTGGRLPGVTLELGGQMVLSAVTDARGEAHFLNLTVGHYTIKATLTGFSEWRGPDIPIQAGVAVPLNVKLSVAGTKEAIVVTADAPVLDNKKQTTAVNVGLDELQNIPTARDPWVVMQSVPGIVLDCVNVGGSESGQQPYFLSKGAPGSDATWNIDGMPITDMSSLSSPFYFDFDMFSEMEFTTGGSDAHSATGGVQMNFMLKSGTNRFHGQAKGYFANESLQSNNLPSTLASTLGGTTGKGDREHLFQDWGGDVGGPILKDTWWFWGAWGDQDIRIIKSVTGATDRTVLQNASIKTNAQVVKSLRVAFSFFEANKKKWGRNAGATCDQNCSLDQQGAGGPNRMVKVEGNYNIGSSLFLVARYAHVRGGFQLVPEGGSNSLTYFDAAGIQHGLNSTYVTQRPQDSVIVDGNYFKGVHEIKFGFAWRKATVNSSSTWGDDYYSQDDNQGALVTGTGYPYLLANVNAPYYGSTQAIYKNFYVGDTITLKRATINLGLRYDDQAASVLPVTEPGLSIPGAPSGILPAVTAPGVDNALVFKLLQPRVGLTYSLTEDRKTQLRATYAMFTSQIGAAAAGFLSVAQGRGFYLDARDLNGDHIAQTNEILWSTYAAQIANGDYYGFDPSNPSAAPSASINKIGSYGNPKTHEFIVGVDRELMPNLGVSASYTYRRILDFNWQPIMNGSDTAVLDGTDYTLVGHVNGSLPGGVSGSDPGTYSLPYYALSSGVTFDPAHGTMFVSHPDYYQVYQGFELTATKRMANHWMARMAFSTNSWREYFSALDAYGNPTPTLSSPNIDGGVVHQYETGSGKSYIYQTEPKYQLSLNGLYQFKHAIDVGANFILRQGYPMPWNWNTTGGFHDPLGSAKDLLLVPAFDYALLPAPHPLDIRLGKRQQINKVTLNFDVDLFNVLNSAAELGREYRSWVSSYTLVREIMDPRIARLGLRIQF